MNPNLSHEIQTTRTSATQIGNLMMFEVLRLIFICLNEYLSITAAPCVQNPVTTETWSERAKVLYLSSSSPCPSGVSVSADLWWMNYGAQSARVNSFICHIWTEYVDCSSFDDFFQLGTVAFPGLQTSHETGNAQSPATSKIPSGTEKVLDSDARGAALLKPHPASLGLPRCVNIGT